MALGGELRTARGWRRRRRGGRTRRGRVEGLEPRCLLSATAVSFERLEPFGGLVFASRENLGTLAAPGLADQYTFFATADETISAVVRPLDPTATLTIELVGHQGPIVASAAGQPVVLPTTSVTQTGTHQLLVDSDTADTDYRVDLVRNAVLEPADSGLAIPLPLDASLVETGTGRYAAWGRTDPQRAGTVWGVRPATGEIVKFDPVSGNTLAAFDAPDALAPHHSHLGLAVAEDGAALLYVNSDVDPTTLYRLHPGTGAVLSTESLGGATISGIGYESNRAIFLGHHGVEVRRQDGYSGSETGSWTTGVPLGGLAGDGDARQFGFFNDGQIREFDPATGAIVNAFVAPAADIEGMAFDGRYLYASTASGTLLTLDPDVGLVLSSTTLVDGALFGLGAFRSASVEVELVGHWTNPANTYGDVWGDGNFAYVGTTNNPAGLVEIVDISDPASPVHAATFVPSIQSGRLQDVKVHRGYGYFASDFSPTNDPSSGGVFVVDLSDPYQPVEVAHINSADGGHKFVHNVFLDGDYLYQVSSRGPEIHVFDISDPTDPQFVRTMFSSNGSAIHDITVQNGRLYASVIFGPGTTDIFDISDVANAAPLLGTFASGSFSHSNWPTADGNFLVSARETAGGDVTIWNVQDPANVTLVATLNMAELGIEAYTPHNPVVRGNHLYVSWYQTGVQIFDITDPTNPIHVGEYDTYPGAVSGFAGNWGVYPFLGPDRVLASDLQGGLFVLDAEPVLLGMVPDVDLYTLDLTGKAGRRLDVALSGQDGRSFAGATLELLAPDGATVLAVGSSSPGGLPATNQDLAIHDFVVPADGVYTLRVKSTLSAEYVLVVTDGLAFDTEPNDSLQHALRSLSDVDGAIGFLRSGRLFAVDATPGGNRIVEYDATTGEEINSFGLPEPSSGDGSNLQDALAFTGTALYFSTGELYHEGESASEGSITPQHEVEHALLYEINPDTGEVLDSFGFDTLALPASIDGLAAYAGLVVASSSSTDEVFFIDPAQGTVVHSWTAAVNFGGALTGAGSRGTFFASGSSTTQIVELDAETGALVNSFSLNPYLGQGLAFVDDALYLAARTLSGFPLVERWHLLEIDPDDGTILRELATGLAADGPRYSALGGDDPHGTLSFGGGGSQSLENDGNIADPRRDLFEIQLDAGTAIILSTSTPFDDSSSTPPNRLDPALSVLDAGGEVLVFDDDSDPDGRNASLVFVAPSTGTYYVSIRGISGQGEYVLHVAATDNLPPTIEPIEDQTVGEGDSLSLLVEAADPDEGQTLTFSLAENTPSGATIDPQSGLLTWTPLDDRDGPVPVTVIVTDDGDPALQTSLTFFVTVENVAPLVEVAGTAARHVGETVSLTLAATDPSPVDQDAGFIYEVDWDGDDTFEHAEASGDELIVQHTFNAAGSYPVAVRAIDKDGGTGSVTVFTVHVFNVGLEANDLVWHGSDGSDRVEFIQLGASDSVLVRTLQVGGQAVNYEETFDNVTGGVHAYGHGGHDRLDATALDTIAAYLEGGLGNDTLLGGGSDDIIKGEFDGAAGDGAEGDDWIEGGAGNDTLYGDGADGGEGGADTIVGGSGNNLIWGDGGDGAEGRSDSLIGGPGNDTILGHTGSDFIDGGGAGANFLIGGRDGSEGDDTLLGGSGNDVLSGGEKNDSLVGGGGRNIILGGTGEDTLVGGTGQDLILADRFVYERDLVALTAIRDEWNSPTTIETRVDHLIGSAPGGANGSYLIEPGTTAFDDEAVDRLIGGGEANWLIYNLLEDLLIDPDPDNEETDTFGTAP